MRQPNLRPLSFGGWDFSRAELHLILEVVSAFGGLGIAEMARTLCELLGWKQPSGGLKRPEWWGLLEYLAERAVLLCPSEIRPEPNSD